MKKSKEQGDENGSRSVPFFKAKRPKLWQPWLPIQDLHDFSAIHMCGVLPIHLKPKVSGDLPLIAIRWSTGSNR
jgi:hypothetical protein